MLFHHSMAGGVIVEEKYTPAPVVGGSSLLVIFGVLCLTVFALLSLSTVQANARLSDISLQSVTDYYTADRQAQELFARLRSGEVPPEVTQNQTQYTFSCPISQTQTLMVELEQTNNGWQVLRWQGVYTELWQEEQHIEVWDGTTEEWSR